VEILGERTSPKSTTELSTSSVALLEFFTALPRIERGPPWFFLVPWDSASNSRGVSSVDIVDSFTELVDTTVV
jgi:hypothetical protein